MFNITWRTVLAVAIGLTFILQARVAMSMEFDLVPLRGGAIAVRATGEISPSDTDRLAAALTQARPTSSGWIPLLLSSPGGDAVVSLDMSLLIRERNVMPVVLPGHTCDSACAAILFLAGKRSLLTAGATLFFHSCITVSTIPKAEQKCNEVISNVMRKEHGITDELLLVTLNAFSEDETAVSREERLIRANVADCLAIDRPLWIKDRPSPTRCGAGDLLTRDPMTAGVDTGPQTARHPEKTPGQVHPVWFLLHWTPPDQWAFWRIEDGVGLGMRPRGTFRNGPEVRLFCHITAENDPGQNDVLLDLRLPSAPAISGAHRVVLQVGQAQAVGTAVVDAFDEGPIVVAGHQVTTRVVTRLPARVWSDLASAPSDMRIQLVSQSGAILWAGAYPANGLSSRVTAAQSNCAGALQPIR